MNDETKLVIARLFEHYLDDPGLMPPWFAERAISGPDGKARVVADYIAGMTDRFAMAEHERLT